MAISRPPKGLAGLVTTFGTEWGRPITLAGGAGGRIYFPDAYRRDWAIPCDICLGGVGLGEPAQTSKLYASSFRATNGGIGRIVVSIVGTKNVTGNVFYAAHASLFPSQTAHAWQPNQAVVVGDRRTNDNRQYVVYSITGGGVTAASGGPTGNGDANHRVVDNQVTWRCIVNGSTHDSAVPDAEFIAGSGGVVNGITLPEGIVPALRRELNISHFNLRCYSNGAAMGDMLIRRFPMMFRSAILMAGCGPLSTDPKYVSTSGSGTSVLVAGMTSDITVRYGGAPPSSTVAIGNHPGNKASLEDLASGMGQTGSLADTTQRLNLTTVAGNETEIWRYPTQLVVGGRNVYFEHLVANLADHNFSTQPDGFAYLNTWAAKCAI